MHRGNFSKHQYGLFIFICVICLLPVFSLTAEGATLADLAGTWKINTLGSGYSTWWVRGTCSIKSNGTFTSSDTENKGKAESGSGVVSISSSGILLAGTDITTSPLCQIDSTNTVLVCTQSSFSEGTCNLAILTKEGGPYSMAEFAGPWEANILVSGAGAGTATVSETISQKGTSATSGTFNGTATLGGTPTTVSGTLSLSAAGVVTVPTCTGAPCPDKNYMSYVDAGDTVSVGISGLTSTDPDAELAVFTRQAGSYSQDDLTGTWQGNSVASGPLAPFWYRYTLTVNSDGIYTGSWTGSDGSTSSSSSGSFAITQSGTTAGAVTWACGDCTNNSSFSGVMDSEKRVIGGRCKTLSG